MCSCARVRDLAYELVCADVRLRDGIWSGTVGAAGGQRHGSRTFLLWTSGWMPKEEEFFGSCGPFCWVRLKADLVNGEQLIRLDIIEEFG